MVNNDLSQQCADPDHEKCKRHKKHDPGGQRHQRPPRLPIFLRFFPLSRFLPLFPFVHRHSHFLYLKNQMVAPEATIISTIVIQKVSILPGNATFMP